MSKFSLREGQRGYLMTVNNLAVGLNMPKVMNARSLPPYHRRRSFLVDEYPACPDGWPKSNGRIKSYFTPIVEGNGLWLDLNYALVKTTMHVAAVISIQGVNPVTGSPTPWPPQLEQFRDKCPKHGKDFGPDRLCKECGYKWPKQNYLASTGTPAGSFWLDGFRSGVGEVSRYVFTADQVKSVAKAIIGEKRAFSIGIAFWLSKTQRPAPPAPPERPNVFYASAASGPKYTTSMADDEPVSCLMDMDMDSTAWSDKIGCDTVNEDDGTTKGLLSNKGVPSAGGGGSKGMSSGPPMMARYSGGINTMRSITSSSIRRRAFGSVGSMSVNNLSEAAPKGPVEKVNDVKHVEIGHGAELDQQIFDDPNGLDFWQDEPEGLVLINYCTEDDCARILAGGKIDVSGNPKGFLGEIPAV